jgi:hypothetical protein
MGAVLLYESVSFEDLRTYIVPTLILDMCEQMTKKFFCLPSRNQGTTFRSSGVITVDKRGYTWSSLEEL